MQFSEDMTHFKKLLTIWNKKYPLLPVKSYEDGMQLKLRVIIKENSLMTVVSAACSIDGLDSINGKKIRIGEDDLSDHISKDAKRVELTYIRDGKENEDSLTFEIQGQAIVLVYSFKDMIDADSPEFQICCNYGLKNMDQSVNLQKMSSFFSFDTDFEEQEGKGEGYLNRMRLFDK
jgi:hypothetical protein